MADTYRADLAIGDVVAMFTKPDVGPQGVQRFGKRRCVFYFVADEMQNQSKGSFLPYTRKLGNLVDGIFDQSRRIIHLVHKILASIPASQIDSLIGLRKSKVPLFTAHLPL